MFSSRFTRRCIRAWTAFWSQGGQLFSRSSRCLSSTGPSIHSEALVGAFMITTASKFIRVRPLFSLNAATITAAGEMPRLLVLGHTWQVSAKPREMWIPHRVSITEASHPSLISCLAHILIETLPVYNSYLRIAHFRYKGESERALVYFKSPGISTSRTCILQH